MARRWRALGFLSMTATSLPSRDNIVASSEPTLPQPTTTTRMQNMQHAGATWHNSPSASPLRSHSGVLALSAPAGVTVASYLRGEKAAANAGQIS